MPRVKTWVRALVAALVAIPALLVAAYFIQVAVLERRLVAEANALSGAPHPRPVHVHAPIPGTFGEALTHYLPAIERAASAYAEDVKALEVLPAILRGERPLADAPPRILTDLDQLGSALDGVLRATHAERADYASVADGFDPSPGTTGLGFQYAAALTGIRVRSRECPRNVYNSPHPMTVGMRGSFRVKPCYVRFHSNPQQISSQQSRPT
jgi:hypothetical protein